MTVNMSQDMLSCTLSGQYCKHFFCKGLDSKYSRACRLCGGMDYYWTWTIFIVS